jgi:hypothetical protein
MVQFFTQVEESTLKNNLNSITKIWCFFLNLYWGYYKIWVWKWLVKLRLNIFFIRSLMYSTMIFKCWELTSTF